MVSMMMLFVNYNVNVAIEDNGKRLCDAVPKDNET